MLENNRPKPGSGEAAPVAAGVVLSKFDKALRARQLYQEEHALVRRFDGELREAMRAFLDTHGDLRLRVRPTSFELGDEPLLAPGCDELALGFLRQGIIALRIMPAITDAQLSSFVDLCNRGLSRRALTEEDLATLLWRANLSGVNYASVLGYSEEDGGISDEALSIDPESVGDALGDALTVDLEKVPLTVRTAFEENIGKHRGSDDNLPAEVIALRAAAEKETRADLLRHAFAIVRAVLAMPRRTPDISGDELHRLLFSFRNAFMQNADLTGLSDLAVTVKTMMDAVTTPPDDRAALQKLVEQRIDEGELSQLLTKVPGGVAGNMDKLPRIIQVLAGNDRGLIARMADSDKSDAGRTALNNMLVDVAGHDAEYLVQRFRSLEGKRAVEALELLARKDAVQARMAVAVRLPGASDETQRELLAAIHEIPELFDARMRASLVRLAAKGGALRIRIFDSFAVHHDPEVLETVWQWMNGKELHEWDANTVEAAFRMVLSFGDRERALPLAAGILARKALFGRKQLAELKLAVIAALADSDDPAANALLEQHMGSKDKDLARACRDAVARRSSQTAAIPARPEGEL